MIEARFTRLLEVSVPVQLAATTGRADAMALYAGESVANVNCVQPAAEIIAELISGAKHALSQASA
jgi:hypothetical protein